MYEILYRYLLKYKKIDLPGIGVLALHMRPAVAEFVNHSFSPPQYFFEFDRTDDVPPERLFSWLSMNLNITEQEAAIRFTDFIFDLTRQLREGKQINWPGVGILQKEFTGEIKFNAPGNQFPLLQKVVAEKVTRENAEHTILVGESEKTSTEMNVLLHTHEEYKHSYWWVWPAALILVLLIFICWHFSENNIDGASGNSQKIVPANAPSGYSLAP